LKSAPEATFAKYSAKFSSVSRKNNTVKLNTGSPTGREWCVNWGGGLPVKLPSLQGGALRYGLQAFFSATVDDMEEEPQERTRIWSAEGVPGSPRPEGPPRGSRGADHDQYKRW